MGHMTGVVEQMNRDRLRQPVGMAYGQDPVLPAPDHLGRDRQFAKPVAQDKGLLSGREYRVGNRRQCPAGISSS